MLAEFEEVNRCNYLPAEIRTILFIVFKTFVMFISPVDTVCVAASHCVLLLMSLFGLLVENASVISVKRDSSLSILSVRSSVESANILFTISIESVKLNGGG